MTKAVITEHVDPREAMGEVDTLRGVRIVYEGPTGREHRVERPIAATLKEARELGYDWYDPLRQSWVRAGNKYEKEYPENAGVPYVPIE